MSRSTAYLRYDYVRFYDWTHQGFLDDLPCYLSLADKYGPKLLELASGTGRLTLPLARKGFAITGLDLSPEMLRIAREKLTRETPEVRARVRLMLGDMSGFDLTERANLVFVPYNSFYHLHTRADQLSCLTCMRKHITPRGAAVLDLNPPALMANQAVGEIAEFRSGENPETGKMTQELGRKLSLDRGGQLVTVEHTYIEVEPDGEEHRYVFVDSYKWVREEETRELLCEAGFREVEVFGSYDFQSVTDTSPRMLFVAR